MDITNIKSLNPTLDDTGKSIVAVSGTVLQYQFGSGELVRKSLTVYIFWNSVVDRARLVALGEKRKLIEIIEAAANPRTPEDDILPKISGFRPPYMGWNGDRFFYYSFRSHKGGDIARTIQRQREINGDMKLVSAGAA